MHFKRAFLRIIIPSVALLLTGCSSFNRDWRAAANYPAPAGDLQGAWTGVWVSETTHHTDKLRCLITKTEAAIYQARFRAKYRHVLTFNYTVPLTVERVSDGFAFKGEADLGKLAGGVYHYEGHANQTDFFSTYSSRYDHGTFQMHRP